MARRHLYEKMFESGANPFENQYDEAEYYDDGFEDPIDEELFRQWYEEEQYEKDEFDKEQFREWAKEKLGNATAGIKETRSILKEESTGKYTERQKKLIKIHKLWRVANWAIIVLLATQAFGSVLSFLKVERTFRQLFIFFVTGVSFSSVMIAFANGTSHDKFRRKTGQIIAIVSEGFILSPILIDTLKMMFMGAINAITSKFGGELFNTGNYKNSSINPFWWLNLVLAGVVCYSLLKEEQSTDALLRSVRTPQKRDIVDFEKITDKEGNKKLRVEKYKQ